MNVGLGSVKPSWDQLCVRLTVVTLPLSHDRCMVRTYPPLSHLVGIVGLLKPGLVP
jgi:hypothetical protein